MKKFNLISSNNPYFNEKSAFEDFIIIDEYLIIRESSSVLTIFKLINDKNDSADFYKEIILENKKEIKTIDAINSNNVFIVYYTNEIYVIDIESNTQQEVIINMNNKFTLANCNNISIHEQCLLRDTNNNIYIGFISVNNTDLYLAYKDWKIKKYFLNVIFIQSFKQEIIHIEYKFFNTSNNNVYCFLCVLCKMEGYVLLSEVKSSYDMNQFTEEIKKKNLWFSIFVDLNSINYSYSFYYSPINYINNSFLIFTDENECFIWTFNQNLENGKFLTKTKHKCKSDKKNSLISINHYDKILYITTKNDFLEFKLPSLSTPQNIINHKNIKGILKTKIYTISNYNFLMVITSKEIFSLQIESDKSLKKVQSNLSLSGIDIQTVNKNNISIKNIGTNEENLNKKSKKTPSISEKNNETIDSIKYNCSVCLKNGRYRCNMCKLYFICEINEHISEWAQHTKNCPALQKTKKIENYNDLIEYKPLWNNQRKEIIELLRKKDYPNAIEKTYSLIQINYEMLKRLELQLKILPFHDINVIKNHKDKILNSYLYYEDYFCNILLLINAFSLFKTKDEVWRLLNRLIKDMETYNFTGVTNIFVELNSNKIKENTNSDKLSKEQEIYLRILKILITIAKYGHSLGEFSFYEKYLLDYIQKIQEVYAGDPYIFYNTYLLLGNLYVEFGLLQKAHLLYDTIIDSNNLSNKEKQNLFDVVLCANYNSGLINFVIDKYEMAKQRLETALRIKRDLLKEKNDLQISTIYETLSEIDIEYKNYASAYLYLQKAIESRELSNTSDRNFQLKAQELREYIEQNSNYTKTDFNSNLQLRRGKNNDEGDNEKIILNMINDLPINNDKVFDVQELEKFFLFMTKLSSEQIMKLNEEQPEDYEKNKYFPIVFSMNFKNSLTHNQRLNLCDLQLTSLTRINVLKDYTKKITIKNLNYNALNLVPPENNLNSIRNLYVTKSILKNWEIKGDEKSDSSEEKKEENSFSESEKKSSEEEEKITISNSNDKSTNKYISDSNNISINNNSEFESQNDENSNKKNIIQQTRTSQIDSSIENNNEDKKEEIDYNNILNSIREYCQNNCPENLKYIDDKFLFLLCREMDMPKEDLLALQNSPEAINLLINTYKEMIEENEEENMFREDNEKFIVERTSAVDFDIIKDFIQDEVEIPKGNIPPVPIPPPLLKK